MNRTTTLLLSTLFFVQASAMSLSFGVMNATCSYANGSIATFVSGGTPPYTYEWSSGQTDANINGLVAGTYSLTVTDFIGDQVSDQATVLSENYATLNDIAHGYCTGQEYHAFFMPQAPFGMDVTPWSTSLGAPIQVPGATDGNYYLVPSGPPGSGFSITFTDVNGCQGELIGTVGYPLELPTYAVLDVQGSCSTINTGSITVAFGQEAHQQELVIFIRPASASFFTDGIGPIGSQSGTGSFTGLAPGDYWITLRQGVTNGMVQGGACASPDSILVTVPDLGPECGTISGSAYMDYNSDCVDNEANIPGAVVEIQPGPYYATTNTAGAYSVVLPYGSYTVTSSAPAVAQSCPAGATIGTGSEAVVANIGHQPTVPLDVAVHLSSGAARPGFQITYDIGLHNLSSAASGATTTVFTFDPALTFVTADPVGNVVGNTITWSDASLPFFEHRTYHVRLQVPPDMGLIGTILNASVDLSTVNSDADLTNNHGTHAVMVTASYDPNEKVAATSSRASDDQYLVGQDDWIDYTIRFQNTGTDTAFTIVVTDTLPATLDPATIALVTASHDFTWSVVGHGVFRAFFPNILLPDSNSNEPRSHGLVSFRIRPMQPVVPGTLISNTANIFFDYNPAVVTEPSVLMAEMSTGVVAVNSTHISLWPDPASTSITITSSGARPVILDMSGRVLQVPLERHNGNVIADVSELPSGIYVVRAGSGSARFVKQ